MVLTTISQSHLLSTSSLIKFSKLKSKLVDDTTTNTRLLDGEAKTSTRSLSVSADQMTYEDVQSVADHLLRRTKIRPEVGIICGSGLGELAEDLDKDKDTDVFPYTDIPNFPNTTGWCSTHVSNDMCTYCMSFSMHCTYTQ